MSTWSSACAASVADTVKPGRPLIRRAIIEADLVDQFGRLFAMGRDFSKR